MHDLTTFPLLSSMSPASTQLWSRRFSAESSCIRSTSRPHSSLPTARDPDRKHQIGNSGLSMVIGKDQSSKTCHPGIWNNAFRYVWRHNSLCLNKPLETALVEALHTQCKIFVLHGCASQLPCARVPSLTTCISKNKLFEASSCAKTQVPVTCFSKVAKPSRAANGVHCTCQQQQQEQ